MGLKDTSAAFHFVRRPAGAPPRSGNSNPSWTPNTDVYLTETGLVIKVEVSGMRKEDLELTVEANRLRINGERRDMCRASQVKFVVMEINYGPFESAIELPPGYDLGSAKASYQNGFLRIDVPAAVKSPQAFSVPIADEED